MNSNIKFDPMTGQPIQVSDDKVVPPVNQSIQTDNQTPNTTLAQPDNNQQTQIQNQMQNIPTVEQNKQDFINNVQSINNQKKEEKKEGINFVFIIIMFIVILAVIYFLFPLLLKYI